MRRLLTATALAAVIATAALTPAQANPVGGSQVVAAVPEAVFAFAIGPSIATRSGSTIPVSVSRERVGDTLVVTLAPSE